MRCALVPLKDLVAAKTRLSGLLTPSERRALMQALVEDVLAVLTNCAGLDRVLLLSDDPGAPLLASCYGVEHVPEPDDCAGDLNRMLAEVIAARPAVEEWLVLHGDLPQLSAGDIDAALALRRGKAAVLGPDRDGRGSNLLFFAADARPVFAFGADSCARHRAWAARAGIELRLLQRSGIASDVDCPDDLFRLLTACDNKPGLVGSHTRELLCGSALGARLAATRDGPRQINPADSVKGGTAPS